MESMQKRCAIDPEKLDKNHLTQSIINEAIRINLISDAQAGNIHIRLITALGECVEWYTRGDSSSVQAETAQSLFASMVYCLDVYLAGLPDACAGLEALESEPLFALYRKGAAQAEKLVEKGKKLYQKVINTRVNTGLIAYNETIDQGIPDFFKAYDWRFGAHETMASIDYPLAVGDTGQTGIIFMLGYMQKLIYENEYCGRFACADIERLISRYGAACHIDGREMLVNVFGLVLTQSFASVLLGSSERQLFITPDACAVLQERLVSDNPPDFEKARQTLLRALDLTGEPLRAYGMLCLNECVTQMVSAARNRSLAALLLTSAQQKSEPEIHFSDGEKMEARQFRSMMEALRVCSDGSQKAALIREYVKCFEDLLDLLSAGCIFSDEYTAVFDALGDFALALLLKNVQCSPFEFCVDDPEPLHMTENEREWKAQFTQYMKKLDRAHADELIKLAGNIGE